MTPERLTEIRALVASWPEQWTDGLDGIVRDLLAAYDAIANGSAVRQAKGREVEAIRRAADAEERLALVNARLHSNGRDQIEAWQEQSREEHEAARQARAERDEARAALAGIAYGMTAPALAREWDEAQRQLNEALSEADRLRLEVASLETVAERQHERAKAAEAEVERLRVAEDAAFASAVNAPFDRVALPVVPVVKAAIVECPECDHLDPGWCSCATLVKRVAALERAARSAGWDDMGFLPVLRGEGRLP